MIALGGDRNPLPGSPGRYSGRALPMRHPAMD